MPKSPIIHLSHHQQEYSASCLAACVGYLHTVVVVGCTETSVWVHDPVLVAGPTEISLDEFKDAWGYSRHMLAAIEPEGKT